MTNLQFQSFHPDLDPASTVMIDGHAPGFRMVSHWPENGTPNALKHDLTTGSAFLYREMSNSLRRDLLGDFSVITNNHYDTDGVLSLFTFLQPDVAFRHQDLILRTARAGDFAVWGGSDALALELAIMSDLGPFLPFTTPPFDAERLENLSDLYIRTFDRLEALLENPFALNDDSMQRFAQVQADIDRIEAGQGFVVTKHPDDDLAVIETDRPITVFGWPPGTSFGSSWCIPARAAIATDFASEANPGGMSFLSSQSLGSHSSDWRSASINSNELNKGFGGLRRRTGRFQSWDSEVPSRFGTRRCASIRRPLTIRQARFPSRSSCRNSSTAYGTASPIDRLRRLPMISHLPKGPS